MSSSGYSLDVHHDGLHTYRRITGRDRAVVQAKATAQMAAWNEKWTKIQQKNRVVRSKEEKKAYATVMTQVAVDAINGIENTLQHSLERSAVFDWEQLKDTSGFLKPKPSAPARPSYPTAPANTDTKYALTVTLWDKLFTSSRRAKIKAAEDAFQQDKRIWETAKDRIDSEHDAAMTAHQESVKAWQAEEAAFFAARDARNAEIDAEHVSYLAKLPEAIKGNCDLVLTASLYPETFPRVWNLDYNPDTKLLLIEYSLPNVDTLPNLKEVKYVASRDEIVEVHFPDGVMEKLYDSLIYKITLRTIHEIFEADVIEAIDAVVFNGWVNAVDKATGQETNGCIVSVQVAKPEFAAINLAKVDPKACFKKLKGVGSSKLAALVPIRPILQLDTQDERFVPSYAVADQLDDSMNLAAMDWEDFEQLIREVFENEFSGGGSEVKITRASRDGGVDAVVFDPDPLRGGKIVIQAKRYTNTVGVSAVRDLYGTVMNEGANKGILVTTADYGPDAYEFAKDKPLTLLSGSNLLHLLAKHGHRARIDLREAKLTLQNATH
ncbi:MAG: restriction endonuclease [Acidobacteriaceae bacterium]